MPPKRTTRDLKKKHTILLERKYANNTRKFRIVRGQRLPERRAINPEVGGMGNFSTGKKVTDRADVLFTNEGNTVRGRGTRRTRTRRKYYGANRGPKRK